MATHRIRKTTNNMKKGSKEKFLCFLINETNIDKETLNQKLKISNYASYLKSYSKNETEYSELFNETMREMLEKEFVSKNTRLKVAHNKLRNFLESRVGLKEKIEEKDWKSMSVKRFAEKFPEYKKQFPNIFDDKLLISMQEIFSGNADSKKFRNKIKNLFNENM